MVFKFWSVKVIVMLLYVPSLIATHFGKLGLYEIFEPKVAFIGHESRISLGIVMLLLMMLHRITIPLTVEPTGVIFERDDSFVVYGAVGYVPAENPKTEPTEFEAGKTA